jgi:ribonucleoside-triphosphate reductase
MENRKTQKTQVKVPCEVYSRVVGYLRPVRNWNNGKKQEFTERKTFKVNPAKD